MGHATFTNTNTILIVEDEAFVRFDLMDFFEDKGFKVYGAENAEQALAFLDADSSIRIVFTDLHVPGNMDGMALAHHIRKRWPPTLLILTSGRQIPDDTSLPVRATFIRKPFDHRAILREIERGDGYSAPG